MTTSFSNHEFQIIDAILSSCIKGHFKVFFAIDYMGDEKRFFTTDTDTEFFDESPSKEEIIEKYFYKIDEQVEDFIIDWNEEYEEDMKWYVNQMGLGNNS